MALTTKEMIAVMEAFEAGKPIEAIYRADDKKDYWAPVSRPSWDWSTYNYRIAVTKPSWDWSHVSEEINFLMRQSPGHGGAGLGTAVRPEKTSHHWTSSYGFLVSAKYFASYNPGTCDWQDSLVVRPGYVEKPR